MKEDLPRFIKRWHRETERRSDWDSIVFGLACGVLFLLACAFGGCAASVGVGGIAASVSGVKLDWSIDPARLAPMANGYRR